MGQLSHVVPVIEAHTDELKLPGVVSIRPGYLLKDGWPTEEPSIVVVVSKRADTPQFPASIDSIPVDVRTASDVEELRFQDPEKYQVLAERHGELRGGAFPEIDPVAGDD